MQTFGFVRRMQRMIQILLCRLPGDLSSSDDDDEDDVLKRTNSSATTMFDGGNEKKKKEKDKEKKYQWPHGCRSNGDYTFWFNFNSF